MTKSVSRPHIASESASKPRISWVDHAKGIGIILVVIGHAIRGLYGPQVLEEDGFWHNVDRWIYLFHMPLFFVLSGLFLARAIDRPLGSFLKSRIGTIAYPYFLWAILQGGIQVAAGQHSASQWLHESANLYRQPVMQFWFLYVLFIAMVLFALLRKARFPIGVILLCALAFYLTTDRISLGSSWGAAYQLRTYTIYIALGMFAGSRRWHERVTELPIPIAIVLTLCSFAVLTGAIVSMPKEMNPLESFVMAMTGIVGTVAFARVFAEIRFVAIFSLLGAISLEIYVAHTIFTAGTRVVLLKAIGSDPAWLHLAAGVLVGIAGPYVIYRIAKRWDLHWVFQLRFPRASAK